MKQKVLVIPPPIHEVVIQKLEREVEVILTPDSKEHTIIEYIKKGINGAIFKGERVTKQIIEAGKNLKVIGKHGVGVEEIDVNAATKNGILVVNTPEANYVSVAEYVIGMMVTLARKFLTGDQHVHQNKWDMRWNMKMDELNGKTVGVVGLGKIGFEVAKKCIVTFSMRAYAYDPYVSEEKARALGVKLVSDLTQLMKDCDFISVHVPLTPETRGLIGKDEMRQMKTGAYLINTSRGAVVDEEALIENLKYGKFGGVGLDVLTLEPPHENHPLFKIKGNIILTPHIAGDTKESRVRMGTEVAEGVLKALRGEKPKYTVNSEVWEKIWQG